MSQEIIYILAGLVGLILGFSFTPKNLLKEVFALLKVQVEINEAVFTLKTLTEEIESKNEKIENLKLSIHELDDVQAQLHERVAFIKQSGELSKLEELRETTNKLNKLQETIKRLKNGHENRFNMAALIGLVQKLYLDLYNQEISVKEVSNLIERDLENSGGTFGGQDLSPKTNKKTM